MQLVITIEYSGPRAPLLEPFSQPPLRLDGNTLYSESFDDVALAEVSFETKGEITIAVPWGSIPLARTMVALVLLLTKRGATRVRCLPSMKEFTAAQWTELAEDALFDNNTDALFYAFVTFATFDQDVFSLGMTAFGMRDVIAHPADFPNDPTDALQAVACSLIESIAETQTLDGDDFPAVFTVEIPHEDQLRHLELQLREQPHPLPPELPHHNALGVWRVDPPDTLSAQNPRV